jgi:carbonic anhydrase/acetyltransferase-like protein (isoleucine patch superfamily)
MPIYALGDAEPTIDPTAWVHPDAVVIGDVTLAAQASVWPCAVLRGDFGQITIGARTSVQDGTIVHCGAEYPTHIGAGCVVGHNAYLEGCTIADEALIGSMATVLPLAVVGRGAVVAAGAVVTRGTEIPARARARGVPARIDRDAVRDGAYARGTQGYVELAERYARQLRRLD